MSAKEFSRSSQQSKASMSESRDRRVRERSPSLPASGHKGNASQGNYSPHSDGFSPSFLSKLQSLIGTSSSFPMAHPLEQSQPQESLQSATGLSQMGTFMPSFPIQPQVQAPTDSMAQLTPTAGVASALMQQLLCSSLNASAPPPQPASGSNLLTQLMAQILATQLAQSTQVPSPSPLAGVFQLLQAFSAVSNSAQPVMPPVGVNRGSIMSQLPLLDAATAKEVIVVLVKQLIQSGDIMNDDISRQFLERLCFPSNKDLCPSSQTSNCWQNFRMDSSGDRGFGSVAPAEIKKEVTSLDDEMFGKDCSSKDNRPNSKTLNSCTDVQLHLQNSEINSDVSDSEPSEDIERNRKRPQKRSSGKQFSKKVKRKIKSSIDTSKEARLEPTAVKTEPIDVKERSSFAQEFHASGKSLRSRNKAVSYNENENDDGLDDIDNDVDYERPSKKLKISQSAKKSTLLNETREDKASKDAGQRKTDSEKSKDSFQRKTVFSSVLKTPAETKDGTAGINQKDHGNSAQMSWIINVKSEIVDTISVLPNVNSCTSPEVRYLFMGRKNDGMEWLNLIAYKPTGSLTSVNQCLFCPMTSSEVKIVADHIVGEHTDLGFVLSNIKQPNGRITFLACRHCSYVTFEPMLMWIHFEMYHSVPGIMDGSSLPQVKVSAPTNLRTISIDAAVNSGESKVAYICLDCMLCSSEGYKVAMHCLDSHPDTTNFNGCFVKAMMIRTKEDDSFTYRQALFEKQYSWALKDAYFCMLCDYTTSTAYLAMSHSLRMHQKKRLMFVCNECEYQCLQESNLMAHMSKSHQFSGIASCMCSTTLVTGSQEDSYAESEIPCNRKKPSGVEKSTKSVANFIQSTTVSSSQKKDKFFTVNAGIEGSSAETKRNLGSDAMPDLEPEIKAEDSSAEHFPSDAPELTPIKH